MSKLNHHLKSVDETYFQHMVHALSFSVNLLAGSICCLVHAFLPFLFEQRGSALVTRMYDRMVVNRKNLTKKGGKKSGSETREQQATVNMLNQDEPVSYSLD